MNKKLVLVEGYWNNRKNDYPHLPYPIPSFEWLGKQAFLDALYSLEEKCEKVSYRGYSGCRLCDNFFNGSKENMIDNWRWPQGFKHYVENHHVRPSLAFQQFVLSHSGSEVDGL